MAFSETRSENAVSASLHFSSAYTLQKWRGILPRTGASNFSRCPSNPDYTGFDLSPTGTGILGGTGYGFVTQADLPDITQTFWRSRTTATPIETASGFAALGRLSST